MEIILYDCRWEKNEKNLKISSVGHWLGFSLLITSLAALLFLGSPFLAQEIAYRFQPQTPADQTKENFGLLLAAKTAREEQKRQAVTLEAEKYGVQTDFSLVIPKISAAAKVIPNVNPADEKEYQASLKSGVGHAAGTGFPGGRGAIYLFAHSTNSPLNISRYNAVFYLLRELENEDEIIVFFAGQKYVYKVTDHFITEAKDLRWLTEESGEEKLILQTCWPPGTSRKRLLVIAKPLLAELR